MADPKPKELIQAEELIKVGNIEEALEIVRKFQQTAWVYNNRRKSDEALKIALQSKELIEKIGKENDLASNLLLLGWIYSQKGDIRSSLNFGIKSIDLQSEFSGISEQVRDAVERVLRSGWFILGSESEAFEKEFSA